MRCELVPTSVLETDDETDAIVAAERKLASVRCSRCTNIAGSFRLVDSTVELICARVPEGATMRFCIRCVQELLVRPLQPNEFAIDPINRPVLAAFALGCDHIGLEARRADALARLADIDHAMTPE